MNTTKSEERHRQGLGWRFRVLRTKARPSQTHGLARRGGEGKRMTLVGFMSRRRQREEFRRAHDLLEEFERLSSERKPLTALQKRMQSGYE